MGDGTKENPFTREDVLRLIKENGGTARGLDLSGKEFELGINLGKLDLRGIILRDATLLDAHLEEAILENAHLEGTRLLGAHLEEAILGDAHFEGAYLINADLEGAYLRRAHLERAWLSDVKFPLDTRLEDVDWGNYILGWEKEGYFGIAEGVYRRLKQWYTTAGMYDIAAKFYYREKEANRKGLKLFSKSSWNHRLAAEFMRAVFGYGEQWLNILFLIAVVIFGLAAAYYLWGSFSSSSFWDTLYYSAVSFTALGYGQWAPQPTGWAKGAGAAEAIIGVFMMALLLVIFVRKWTR
jgi:hypothetical protein